MIYLLQWSDTFPLLVSSSLDCLVSVVKMFSVAADSLSTTVAKSCQSVPCCIVQLEKEIMFRSLVPTLCDRDFTDFFSLTWIKIIL